MATTVPHPPGTVCPVLARGLAEAPDRLVDAVGPLARGVLGAVPPLGVVEDGGFERPLERLQVDSVGASFHGVDQQPVSEVVVAGSLGDHDVDEILGRQRAEVRSELLGGPLGQLGHVRRSTTRPDRSRFATASSAAANRSARLIRVRNSFHP